MKQGKRLPTEPGTDQGHTDVSGIFYVMVTAGIGPTSRVRKMILYWY